jgi:hypothetical protein
VTTTKGSTTRMTTDLSKNRSMSTRYRVWWNPTEIPASGFSSTNPSAARPSSQARPLSYVSVENRPISVPERDMDRVRLSGAAPWHLSL